MAQPGEKGDPGRVPGGGSPARVIPKTLTRPVVLGPTRIRTTWEEPARTAVRAKGGTDVPDTQVTAPFRIRFSQGENTSAVPTRASARQRANGQSFQGLAAQAGRCPGGGSECRSAVWPRIRCEAEKPSSFQVLASNSGAPLPLESFQYGKKPSLDADLGMACTAESSRAGADKKKPRKPKLAGPGGPGQAGGVPTKSTPSRRPTVTRGARPLLDRGGDRGGRMGGAA